MSKSKNKANSKAKPKGNKVTGSIRSTMTIARQVQANPSMVMTRGQTDSIRVRNQEALNISLSGATTAPYLARNFFRLAAAGTGVGTSWLPAVAKQYSMYRFHNVTVRFVPTTGTTQSGLFAMGFFPDTEEASFFFNSAANGTLAQLSQCRRYTQGPLYAEAELKLTKADYVLDWYYVEPAQTTVSEVRLSSSGGVGIIVQTNASLLDASVGVLYIDYDIELKFPVTTNPDLI